MLLLLLLEFPTFSSTYILPASECCPQQSRRLIAEALRGSEQTGEHTAAELYPKPSCINHALSAANWVDCTIHLFLPGAVTGRLRSFRCTVLRPFTAWPSGAFNCTAATIGPFRCPQGWRPKLNHHTLTGGKIADCCADGQVGQTRVKRVLGRQDPVQLRKELASSLRAPASTAPTRPCLQNHSEGRTIFFHIITLAAGLLGQPWRLSAGVLRQDVRASHLQVRSAAAKSSIIPSSKDRFRV